MKTFAAFTVAGVAGAVLLKIAAMLLLPLLGLFFGLMAMVVKLALLAAVIFFVYSMLNKRRNEAAA